MRTREEVYDDLLQYQAALSFDLELSYYQVLPSWERCVNVLDIGAGNCYYASLLAKRWPAKRYVCIERDGALAERATRWTAGLPIATEVCDFMEFKAAHTFDFVIARHMASYLSAPLDLFKWIAENTTNNAGLLLIDADDSVFAVKPPLPLLERGNEEFKDCVRTGGGDRNIAQHASDALLKYDFNQLWSRPIFVHSDIAGRKSLMYMFMRTVGELDHGSPMPPPLDREITAWASDPNSFLQIGMRATAFERQGS